MADKVRLRFNTVSFRVLLVALSTGTPCPRSLNPCLRLGPTTRVYVRLTRRKSRNCWWFKKTGGEGSGGPNSGTDSSENMLNLQIKQYLLLLLLFNLLFYSYIFINFLKHIFLLTYVFNIIIVLMHICMHMGLSEI